VEDLVGRRLPDIQDRFALEMLRTDRKRDFWFLPMEKGLSVVASTI